LSLAVAPKGLPMSGITPLALLALIYPILTLVLLNTTFRSDFVQ
jgi:hypothetical protein